jgi:hypothetical protein
MRRLLPVLLLAAAACGNEHSHDLPDAGFNCEIDQRDEEFVSGMQKTGDLGVTFTLVSSDPTPPARDDNDWVVDIEDPDGPMVGGSVTVRPFMPDHNHGTSIPAVITEDATTPGRYELDRVNLFMPGIWEITLGATPAGGTAADKDTVVFTFCVAS